jgi:hypothetical protein
MPYLTPEVKAVQRLLLFPVTRPETLVAGVTIFMVVGMALYGAEVGLATGLDRFNCGDEQAMVTKQRGCEGLMQ